jgi:hypothetical protein
MTEQEWFSSADVRQMADGVLTGDSLRMKDYSSKRKFLLYVCAHTRNNPGRLGELGSTALDAVERYADGSIEMEQARSAINAVYESLGGQRIGAPFLNQMIYVVDETRSNDLQPESDATKFARNANILRDIVGPLVFRSVHVSRQWLTANVASLAQAIYDDRAFDRLPILADALEDAGCDNADILNHCRQPGEHVRGCWVVDLVLGRE